jgi:hypothetical protein
LHYIEDFKRKSVEGRNSLILKENISLGGLQIKHFVYFCGYFKTIISLKWKQNLKAYRFLSFNPGFPHRKNVMNT